MTSAESPFSHYSVLAKIFNSQLDAKKKYGKILSLFRKIN